MKNLILLLLCFSTSFIQAQPTFQKTYGRQYADFANSIEKTFDGGFILCGTTSKDSSQGDVDILLIKLNAYGDTLWTKSFGGTQADFGQHA